MKEWYKSKLLVVSLVTTIVLLVSYSVSFLRPVYDAFIDYANLIWWAILLGFFIGGVIDYLVPQLYISKYLAQKKKRTILYATLFGFLMSACSHGILAISIELYRKGASIPAVIAFLLSSPWANLPITIILFGFFGIKALFIIISAIVIAITTGLIYQILEDKKLIESSKKVMSVDEKFSILEDIKQRFREYQFSLQNLMNDSKGVLRGSWSLTKMVFWWILIGMLLASFARAFIPVHYFHQFLGPTILGIIITLALATLIEVCSEGTSPIAFEIFRQTGAFGNSFTFLMAGVATDYTEIGLLWSNIGRKTALWLPVITVPQILILAYLFNTFI